MKRLLGIFLLIILLLTGLTTCSKEEPISGDQVIGLVYFLTTDDVDFITCVSARSGGYIIDNVGESDAMTARGVCWSTTPNPTTADNKVTDNIYPYDPKHFSATIYGLNPCTNYYVRAFATNSAGTVYGNKVSFTTPECTDPTYGSVSDIDGNIYKTFQIGTQTWMAENLKTNRYNDGSQILNVTGDADWVALKTGAYRWYNNDAATYKNTYGALYNWYTVKTGKLCPTGWHVPSDDEWKQLEMSLGMTQAQADDWGEFPGIDGRGTDQGTQMRTTSGWNDWEGEYGNGTNTIGFSGLPGGDTGWYGPFELAGQCGSWWASTEGVARVLGSGEPGVIRGVFYLHTGFSVRCLKD
jgi:uncharacterized protein (TIGR02145 family)